jgi:asparagine synthase (glutamine-hydrolysing)
MIECMHNGLRKAVLRETQARFVPADLITMPKRGFAVPLREWLQGPLRPLVEETLFQNHLYQDGIFNRQC